MDLINIKIAKHGRIEDYDAKRKSIQSSLVLLRAISIEAETKYKILAKLDNQLKCIIKVLS